MTPSQHPSSTWSYQLLVNLSLVGLLLGMMSCGGGGKRNPLAPDGDLAGLGPDTPVPAALTEAGWQSGASSMFGLVSGTIAPDGTVEVQPLRNASGVGSVYDVDATQFFKGAPCLDCAKVAGFSVSDTSLNIDFSIRHPFPDSIPRRDLHVFDVRGILIAPGMDEYTALSAPINTDLTTIETLPVKGDPMIMLNADGYTTHFDYHAEDPAYFPEPRDIPGNLNPFRRFFVNPSNAPFSPASPVGWNVLPMGADYETQTYEINRSRLVVDIPFVFVVDARWGESATFQTRNNPSYYLPAFSRQEAWSVDVAVTANNLQSGDTTSSASIEIAVKDWQAAATVSQNFPDAENPGHIPWAGDVGRIDVEVLGLSNLDQTAEPQSGGGTDANPYIYTLNIRNDLGAGPGYYTGLVAVRDELFLAAAEGPAGLPELPGVNQGLDIKDYTAYQMFQVMVDVPQDDPPVADASATSPTSVVEGNPVTLNGSLSVDDGTIVKYEWDPGDGGGFVDRGTDPTLVKIYALPAQSTQEIFTATLRVTDDIAQQTTDTVQVTVSKTPDNPPSADAQANPSTIASGGTVQLNGSGSTDDFGIAQYRWNPGDGTGWINNGTIPNLDHIYTAGTSTTYTATIEVTDTSAQVDTDTVQVNVTVTNQPPVASLSGTAPTSGNSPLLVDFNGGSSSDDQGIVDFEWDPGDGSGWSSTGAVSNFAHSYTVTSSQTFTARLRVTDGAGLDDTASISIDVDPASPCSLTGISGNSSLSVGQTITLTAVGSSGSYSWSETSPKIEFVGSTTGNSVQVRATAASSSTNDIQVKLTGSGSGCEVTKQLTAYKVEFTVPASTRKQYVNWAGSATPTDDTDVLVTARVVPSKSGVPVVFTFQDPDEPTFTYVAGTSWTSGGETVETGEADSNDNDNNGDNLRPDGSSGGGAYQNGYDVGGGIFDETTTVSTNASGEASAYFRVSRYAGDNYTFRAVCDPAGAGIGTSATSPLVTVWRRYLVPVYSMENAGGTNELAYQPDTADVNTIMGRVYIEVQSMNTGFGGMSFYSPMAGTVSDQFTYVETTSNYDTASEKYAQTPHGQFCGGIDRYASSGTIGLWTGSYNPSKLPPTGVGVNDKPYNTRNYFTVASGRMDDFWNGTTLAELQNHVFVHEMGHGLGLPHNSSNTSGNPPLSKHGSSGIGVMAPATGPGISHYFTLAETGFLRGADQVGGQTYRGPYFE